MGKTWIDDKGRLRLDHDENYQMVSSGTFADDVALQMDSWDIERACKMIVLGFNENTKEAIEYGLKHCPDGSTGRDRAHALITIMNRILTLAKSAIAIGILKETDTPTNWLTWAQSKGYNTDHLNPSIQITPILMLATEADGAIGHAETDTKPEGKNQKRMNILTEWYVALCDKHENNRELIIQELNRLTNEEIKIELANITPQTDKYIWANGADRWIMDNGESVWQFKRNQGGKSKKP